MNIKILLPGLFALLSLQALGQQRFSLEGQVGNELAEPVESAAVYILNTNFSTFTDNEGEFLIEGLDAGEYMLMVSAPGYASQHERIHVPAETELQIRLQSSTEQLSAVTVSAQKREEDLQEVPFSISTLSSAKVQEYKLWNGKDLAAVIPNLYVAHPGDNRNVFSVRGITTTSYDPAITTYIDGVSQFGLDTYIAQLLDIERVEVLRGPQGTLYGRNAMGGVVNIITRQPGNTTSGYVNADLGNYGLQRYSLGLRTPLLPGKLFLGVAGMYDRQDGFYTNAFDGSDYDRANSFMGNYFLKYLPSARWSIGLNVKHDQNRNHGAFPLVADPQQAIENPFEVNQNALTELVDNTLNASLSANYYGEKLNFASQTAWQSNYRYYTDPIDGDFNPIDAITVINNYGRDWNRVKVLTQEFRLSSGEGLVSPLRWTAGVYGFVQDNPVRQGTHYGEDAGAFGVPAEAIGVTQIVTNEGTARGIAFYGQASYELTERLSLTAGLRYDYERKELSVLEEAQFGEDPAQALGPDTSASASFSAFSPKLSLAYALSEQNRVYLSYSQGFRAGGITQLGSDPGAPPLYPYDPEYSSNLEAGFKNMLAGGRVRLNLSAFYTWLRDAQVPTLVLPEAITITRNAGKLESKGFESEIAATPLKGLELVSNIGFTDAKYTELRLPVEGEVVNLDGNRQIFTPKMTAMHSVQYSYALPSRPEIRLIAGGQWQYLGSQYFDLQNRYRQEGYHLFHARAGVSTRHFELFLWGRNLSDKTYIDYTYDFGATHLGEPATYGVSLTAKL